MAKSEREATRRARQDRAPQSAELTPSDGGSLTPAPLPGAPGRPRGFLGVVPRLSLFVAALGPGVIGLCADNDAGGMLSYLVTGASHELAFMLPALLVLVLPTLFIQWVALRVARATRLPYSKVLIRGIGKPPVMVEALALYGINLLILVTEFVGMSLALRLLGLPVPVSLLITLGLVIYLTSAQVYPRIERLLLWTALANLAFIPALILLHRTPDALATVFVTSRSINPWFLLLAMSGNAIAPWMIYWQQNAVWAGATRTRRQYVWDLSTGVIAMVVMATVVLLLGALTPGSQAAYQSPVVWIFHQGGHLAGILFAIGLFDAGLLAACTVSLSSLWTVREAVGRGARRPSEAPNRGKWMGVHVVTLTGAAAVVLAPHLSSGWIALWAQAAGALWMPVSLVLLGLVARNRTIMGRRAIGTGTQVTLAVIAAGFLTVGLLGLLG
ncbi:MAG: NRAMP family divalent metal transporter [Clostridia bacterium]